MPTHGSHERLHAEEPPATGSDRSFCLFFAALSAGAAVYLRHQLPLAALLAGLAALLLAVGLLRPALAAPLNRAWGKLGLLLARITNPVLLLALYACIMVPAGLLLQLLGKKRATAPADTYWIPREPPGPLPASMNDQF